MYDVNIINIMLKLSRLKFVYFCIVEYNNIVYNISVHIRLLKHNCVQPHFKFFHWQLAAGRVKYLNEKWEKFEN